MTKTSIRPYYIGYRIVSQNGNIFALQNGASVFSLPLEAQKAVQKEFGRDNPDFCVQKYMVEEVAVVNFKKLAKFMVEVGR